MRDLSGRTALVTGASRGAGEAIAHALSAAGVKIVGVARSRDRLEKLREAIANSGGEVAVIACDLENPDAIERLRTEAPEHFGPIDILVNNAAMAGVWPFESIDPATIERELRVDLLAPMLLTRALLPEMLARGTGHVVNVSSLGGRIAFPCMASYAAAKAGLILFTESLRAEFRDRGVSASAILPGVIRGSGMAHDFEQSTGFGFPRSAGGCTAERIGREVVRAIRRDRPECIVNWPPVRPSLAHMTLFPGMRERILRALGAYRLCREAAAIAVRQAEAKPSKTPTTSRRG